MIWKLFLPVFSFFGLCEMTRAMFDERDRGFHIPLITICLMMCLLMFAGMAGLLFPAWLLLISLGCACAIYFPVIRKRAVHWPTAAVMAGAALMALIVFRGHYYTGNDTVSHWGLVVKYLVRTDHFPDSTADVIYFPSYPVGTGVTLYFFCRLAGIHPALLMGLSWMGGVIAVMPMLSMIRKNRLVPSVFAALSLVCLVVIIPSHARRLFTLIVDFLIGQLALGGTCLIRLYRESPRKMMMAVLPVAVGLVFVKSTGIVFGVLLILLVMASSRRSPAKRLLLSRALPGLLAVGLAFLVWQVHCRLAFHGSGMGKHAVTLENYASTFRGKNARQVLDIAVKMLRRLIHLRQPWYTVWAAMSAGLAAVVCFRRQESKPWLFRCLQVVLFSGGVLAAWYVMLFAMYIFSMPLGEAQRLASIQRYECTAIIYALGVLAMFAISYLQAVPLPALNRLPGGIVFPSMAACALLAIALCAHGPLGADLRYTFDTRQNEYAPITSLRVKNHIDDGKRYLVFSKVEPILAGGEYGIQRFRACKYEFFSNNITVIYYFSDPQNPFDTRFVAYHPLNAGRRRYIEISDISRYLDQSMNQFDYLLVCDKVSEFEEALDAQEESGDTTCKVCFSYDRNA